MDDKILKILYNSNKDIDNQKLMDYLSAKLSAEEKHEIEKQMADSDFVNDAVEGLEDVKNKKDLSFFVEQLNADLHKQLSLIHISEPTRLGMISYAVFCLK